MDQFHDHPRATEEIAAALIGSWAADVTEPALEAAGEGPSENGEVGHWVLTFTENGRIAFDGPGVSIDARATVDGDILTVDVDSGSLDWGLGEVWKYSWSVFRDTLTLTRVPAPGVRAGPTFMVSQPFERP